MLFEEITEEQKYSVIYKDNKCAILLAKNRQVGTRNKNTNICNHFLRDMVKNKDIDIQYIWSEDNPAEIITKDTSEKGFVRQMKRITEGELWELVDTGRDNVNNTRVTYDVINLYNNEYSSHAIAEVAD